MSQTLRSVVGVGAVPPGLSGVTDYGRLLSEELRRAGVKVDERWIVNRGLRFRDAATAALDLLRLARAVPRETVVLWHYSSFSYTLRGVAFPGVLFGLVLRHRRVAVVTLLHEPAYDFGRRGWKGSIQALTQQLALPFVLAGSDELVVTTSRRAQVLRRAHRGLRRPVHCVPVFSTLGDGADRREATSDGRGTGPPVIGVPSWTSDGVRPGLLIEALRQLPSSISPRIRLLGAAEATSAEATAWLQMATKAGLGDRIELTGIVSAEELSRRMGCCDLIVFVNGEGPSSRKTTLAAALAHGMPIVALDGGERWFELVDAGAVALADPRPEALSAAVCLLLTDGRRRSELGARARSFYERHMTLAGVADALNVILAGAAPCQTTTTGRRSS